MDTSFLHPAFWMQDIGWGIQLWHVAVVAVLALIAALMMRHVNR